MAVHRPPVVVGGHEQVRSHDQDRLAGVGRGRQVGTELDHVAPEGGPGHDPRQQPDHDVQPRPLVAADGDQEPLVGPGRVGEGIPPGVDDPALGERLACLGLDTDRAVRGDGGGDVELEGDLLAGGEGHRDGVGSQQPLATSGRGHAVAVGHGEVQPDQTAAQRHRRVDAGGAGMVGVDGPHPAQPGGLGLADRHLHRPCHHRLSQTVVPVHEGRGRRLSHHPDVGIEVDRPGFDPAHVRREPDEAVAGPSSQVGLHHPLPGHPGVLRPDAVGDEHGGDESDQPLGGKAPLRHDPDPGENCSTVSPVSAKVRVTWVEP